MCGIVGIVGNGRSVPVAQFLEMRDSIAHRGPDDAGLWQSPSGTTMLGSRRLAILDLSLGGHQPMEDDASSLVIVFNGEIYNYLELANELGRMGYHFHSRSDTEVLLKSYEAWGSECLNRLNGMFAFAIWDERKQELFAARDRFGEKPFYYYQNREKDLFAFGSEIKALISGGFFSPHPNHRAIYGYLSNREIDFGSETVFEDVFALPAAHALRFAKSSRCVKVWRYWDLDPHNELRLSKKQEYADGFLEILADSVRIRLRSDVPVGSSLSGGLDSSTIVGLISKNGAEKGQVTFSARFSEAEFDEGKYIARMASWAKIRSHITYPDPRRIPAEIESLTWQQDEPFYGPSVYAQWCVMRLAQECGVTVLLDGQGGDEVLAGYHEYFGAYYKHLIKKWQFPQLVLSVGRYLAEHGWSQLPLISSCILPNRLRSAATEWLRPKAVRKEFQDKWGHPPTRISRKYGDELHQSLYASLTQTSLPQLLRYADRNSMAFSREVRLPFLDHRLVEFTFAIPADQKIHGCTTKVVLRNAISGIVPAEIQNRKDKMGFGPPEASWLRGPLRSWVREMFLSTEFRGRDWLQPTIIDSVWNRFIRGEDGLLSSIWRWISLEVWARIALRSNQSRERIACFSHVEAGNPIVPSRIPKRC